MGYDNRILNINGKSDAQLLLALQFAFRDQYDTPNTCKGWEVIPAKGLVLYQYYSDHLKNVQQFPAKMSADEVFPIVKKWLASDDAKKIPHENWDVNMSHDGSNIVGWRMYLEDWGHIDGNWGALCCIKPAYLWLGK